MDKWKLRNITDVSPSPWFPIERHEVELSDGRLVDDYYITTLADVAMVLPITIEGKLVLVKQYKHGQRDFMLELPAGFVQEGKSITESALAELKEETGILTTADNLTPLGHIAHIPTKSTQVVHAFLATNLEFNTTQNLDDLEEIEVVEVLPSEALDLVLSGDIWGSDSAYFILRAAIIYPEYFGKSSDGVSQPLGPISQWIKSRQSIFPNSFTGEKVSDEVILQILENANTAPSHRNTEPWRFKIITPSKLEDFSEFLQAQYKATTNEHTFVERKYKKLRKKVMASSHVIIISMQRDESESVPEWEELAATACAVQNIYLSLSTFGLGGYWSSPALVINHISKYIPLAKGERNLGLFYIGKVNPEGVPPIKNKGPLETKLTWIR